MVLIPLIQIDFKNSIFYLRKKCTFYWSNLSDIFSVIPIIVAQPFQEKCEYKMSSFVCCLTVLHDFQAVEINTLASIQMNCSCAVNKSECYSVTICKIDHVLEQNLSCCSPIEHIVLSIKSAQGRNGKHTYFKYLIARIVLY